VDAAKLLKSPRAAEIAALAGVVAPVPVATPVPRETASRGMAE
jgi:hypothetical protein